MSINFTNSKGTTINLTHIELSNVLVSLNATNTYFVNANNYLVYVRVNTGLLLIMDLYTNMNRKIFELYTIGYDMFNQFLVKFTHNDTTQ